MSDELAFHVPGMPQTPRVEPQPQQQQQQSHILLPPPPPPELPPLPPQPAPQQQQQQPQVVNLPSASSSSSSSAPVNYVLAPLSLAANTSFGYALRTDTYQGGIFDEIDQFDVNLRADPLDIEHIKNIARVACRPPHSETDFRYAPREVHVDRSTQNSKNFIMTVTGYQASIPFDFISRVRYTPHVTDVSATLCQYRYVANRTNVGGIALIIKIEGVRSRSRPAAAVAAVSRKRPAPEVTDDGDSDSDGEYTDTWVNGKRRKDEGCTVQ